jgi:hypothetical protein
LRGLKLGLRLLVAWACPGKGLQAAPNCGEKIKTVNNMISKILKAKGNGLLMQEKYML